jgi:uncharacterized protein (TIGR02646 family)
MRQVDRSVVPLPETLQSPEVRAARRAIEAVLLLPEEERRQRRAPYNVSFLQSDDVRENLAKLFANRCAYCESKLASDSANDVVEQFRPINVAQEEAEHDAEHHYAWLAYEWANLYLVCRRCNLAKGNQFPVVGSRAPMLSSLDEIWRIERQQLIDPCKDDPARHLQFYWNGEVRGRTDRGTVTVQCYALNRSDLVKQRQSAFNRMLGLLESDVNLAGQLYRDREPYCGALDTLLHELAANFAEKLGTSLRKGISSFDQLTEFIGESRPEELLSVLAQARADAPSVEDRVGDTPVVFDARAPSELSPAGSTLPPASTLMPSEISIRNYRGIRELKFTMPAHRLDQTGAPCLMLIGENACGKSSVLEAIALILAGTNPGVSSCANSL